MFCTNCGSQNNDGSKFCTSCGKPLATNVIPEAPPKPQPTLVSEEKLEIWMWILIIFFPVIGIILFFVWMKEKPKKSRQAIIAAGVGFLLSIIFGIISFFIGLLFLGAN